jgi:hypothetical protein
MDWGEEVSLTDDGAGAASGAGAVAFTGAGAGIGVGGGNVGSGGERKSRVPLKMVCVPCQHWCKRGMTDTNKCLWSSWICAVLVFDDRFSDRL